MVASYEQVRNRVPDLESEIGTGSAAVIAELISGAQAYIDDWTGNQTGDLVDAAMADLASAMLCDQMMASTAHGVNVTVGGLSVSSKDLATMSSNFRTSSQRSLASFGKDGKIEKVND